MNLIEPLQLQRLVDGELDFEETRRLLQLAEREPATWREIATTFVENRIWQSEFVDRSSTRQDISVIQPRDSKFKSNADVGLPRSWWMSLAASVALALSVGFLLGHRSFDSNSVTDGTVGMTDIDQHDDSISAETTPFDLAQADRHGDKLDLQPAVYHMQLQDQTGNQFLDSEIPLYAAKQTDDLRLLQDAKIPDSIREQASDSGYQVRQDIRYVSGRLVDGRQFVIPIRNYLFSPHQ